MLTGSWAWGRSIGPAFADFAPGLHPLDWLIGIVGAVGFRLLIYMKSKNAKKFRRDEEYGSARWGMPEGHRSLYGPGVPEQRHSDPDRTAYHVQPPQEPQVCPKQKCAGYRRQRLRQDPLLVEAEPDADAQFLCGHGPERHHPGGSAARCSSAARPSWARTASR